MDTELLIILAGVGTAFLALLFGVYNIAGGFRGIYDCCVNKISPEDEEDYDDDDEEGGGSFICSVRTAAHDRRRSRDPHMELN